MKAKLLFNLSDPDDFKAHLRALKATELCKVIEDTRAVLRKYRKYVDMNTEQEEMFNRLDDELVEILTDPRINDIV